MQDTPRKISELFQKSPEALYGFSDISFSDYRLKYGGAFIFALPHAEMLTLETYSEPRLENLIAETRVKGEHILTEIESILREDRRAYEIPSAVQTNEETLLAPFSFKFAAVHAHLGWIGRNGLLITKAYGPRVRLFAVLADFHPPVASPMDSQCPDECFLCIKACPYHAARGYNMGSEHQTFRNH